MQKRKSMMLNTTIRGMIWIFYDEWTAVAVIAFEVVLENLTQGNELYDA
jgi:hypothetical protein